MPGAISRQPCRHDSVLQLCLTRRSVTARRALRALLRSGILRAMRTSHHFSSAAPSSEGVTPSASLRGWLSLAFASVVLIAPAACTPHETVLHRDGPSDTLLAQALVAHGDTDQAIRDTMVQLLQHGQTLDSTFAVRMGRVDSANTEWLKRVVAQGGWPGRSRVGQAGAQAAFLIVQHAVQDTAFQAKALGLMEAGVASHEVNGSDVAMLADRLAVHRGQRQVYGTQAELKGGRVVLDPIEDSAHVDERRARVGLPPLAEYVRLLDSMYTTSGQK